MGQIGLNPGLVPGRMPVIGKGVPSQLVLFHQGGLPGALAIFMLLPDSDNMIIVLSSSLAITDAPELVLEQLLEALEAERVDFLAPAKAAAAEKPQAVPGALSRSLTLLQRHGISPRNVEEYTGVYWIDAHIFKIDVTLEDGRLFLGAAGVGLGEVPTQALTTTLSFGCFRATSCHAAAVGWARIKARRSGRKAEFRASSGPIDELYWAYNTDVQALNLTKE